MIRGADLLAGQSITAIYEIVPAGQIKPARTDREKTRWQKTGKANRGHASDELLTARINYRLPDRTREYNEQTIVRLNESGSALPSDDFEFSAAVAACALLLD